MKLLKVRNTSKILLAHVQRETACIRSKRWKLWR